MYTYIKKKNENGPLIWTFYMVVFFRAIFKFIGFIYSLKDREKKGVYLCWKSVSVNFVSTEGKDSGMFSNTGNAYIVWTTLTKYIWDYLRIHIVLIFHKLSKINTYHDEVSKKSKHI